MQTKAERQDDESSSENADKTTGQAALADRAAFDDLRPETVAQRHNKDLASFGPRVAGQRVAENAVGRSPDDVVTAANRTGLPDHLKSGIESISGISMDGVKVHYNSSRPAQLNALAYAHGSDIHIGPGQEQHLPHEAWHIVQQAQGRVQPTIQAHGMAINDNLQLEREADEMGTQASQAAVQAVSTSRARAPAVSSTGHPIAQRMLVIGGVNFYHAGAIRRHASDALGATASSVENLVGVGTDPEVIASFPDWNTATAKYDFANDYDSLALAHDPEDGGDAIERSELPFQIVNSVLFRIQMSPDASLASQVLQWALAEARSLINEISDMDLIRPVSIDFARLKQACSGLIRQGSRGDLAELCEPAIAFHARITNAYHAAFKLQDRDMRVQNGVGGKHAVYGYHLTKLSNIPGIRASGLQPHMGASDRGSVAMSTADQKGGSVKTSKNMVAFAQVPSTFRPYINQFEDRRQMVEGAPMTLKPLMLRFHIDAAIGKSNVMEGLDFMDGNALNTDKPVLPKFIEVLTPIGWISIQNYDTRSALLEMRSGNDNSRTGEEWAGSAVVLSREEIAEKKIFPQLLDLFKQGPIRATAYLESQRDRQVYDKAGVKLTFRGASMQTSGNPHTWDYAFTALAKSLPNWVERARARYVKEIGEPAARQLAEFNERGD